MVKDAARKKAIRAIMAELNVNYMAASRINAERRRNREIEQPKHEHHEPDQRRSE